MKRVFTTILLACVVLATRVEARDSGFLSAPSSADPLAISLAHLRGRQAARGLTARDVDGLRVTSRRLARRTGATHLHFQQSFAGIDVLLAGIDSTVDRTGRLVAFDDRMVANIARAIATTTPSVSPLDAMRAAARAHGLEVREPLQLLAAARGAAQEARISRGGISLDDVPAKLVYLPVGATEVRLAWSIVIRSTDHLHWWQVAVDAATGTVLRTFDWMVNDSYRVHPLPLSNAEEGPRTLESNPADALASPFGWLDTNGVAGPELTDTRGNNVRAQEDADADDLNGATADGGPTLTFDFPWDPAQAPAVSQSASITQLFYMNNVLHDVFYHFGFDESAGNFQQNDYGRGGLDLDPVLADTLDGSGFNNANFGTPPDGEPPRMQMFVFRAIKLTVTAPAGLAGDRNAIASQFGPLPPVGGLSGDLVEALDPSDAAGPSVRDGCTAFTNAAAVAGKIALIERGTCDFVDKVRHAQDAGAVAVVVYNNVGGLVAMGGTDPAIVIPAVFISQSNGIVLRDALPSATVSVTLTTRLRDSSFDNQIVVHEYAHGVTTRMTGGPSNVLCLQLLQSGGMGEGWSDFFALAFTQKPGGTRTDPREMGAYSLGDAAGPGIRRFPYSTDLLINPLTLANLGDSAEVHNIGEIWAVTLWEMYWNLVDRYGFSSTLAPGTAGNQIAMQLVIDALTIQPCSPSFTDARDAILQADVLSHGGANRCDIWKAFARRGIGNHADAGASYDIAATPSFTPPPDCLGASVQNDKQRACIYALNESLRRVMDAQGKNDRRCISGHAGKGLPTTAEVCLIADSAETVQRARARTEDQESRRCSIAPDFGKTDAESVNNAGAGAELGLLHDVFGANVDDTIVRKATNATASRCQLEVAKSVGLCRNAQLKAFDRCKKSGLKSGAIQGAADLAVCLGDDPRAQVAKACDPVTGRIATRSLAEKCGDPSLDLSTLFPACASDDPAVLAQCLENRVSCRVCAAVVRADDLDTVIDCDLFDNGVADSSCTPLP